MASYFRYDGSVTTPSGPCVPGASIAVLYPQPASFASQPGSPLTTLYAASSSNAATITNAVWLGGQITFTFSTTPPSDVVAGSWIAVSGVTPTAFNTTVSAPWLVLSVTGDNVVVLALTSPGTYVSGGTVATSALPNPTTSDNNGNFYFYAAPGLISVQIYGPTITERDLPDQGLGVISGGSVTSVALALPTSTFTISGSPVTSTGTLTGAFATQSANTFLAGPTSGSAATPAWRALVVADIPTVSPRVPAYPLTGTTDAINYPGANFILTGAIDNTTLATPTPGTDDGKICTIISNTAFAHTITTASNKIVPSHHLVTFGAAAGIFVELIAYSGLWYPLANGGGLVIS